MDLALSVAEQPSDRLAAPDARPMRRSASERPVVRDGGAGDASRFARELSRARRHTVLVRVLRVGLPLAAAGIVAAGIAVTVLARQVPAGLSVASATIGSDGIVMNDPRMSGFDRENRPYSLHADRAVQALDGSGIDLEKVLADISVGTGTTARIAAGRGRFDPQRQTLRLFDTVHVAMSDGRTIDLSAADIDLKAGALDGQGPVLIASEAQTVHSSRVSVRERGASLTFDGPVKMILNPSAPPSGAAQPSRESR